MQRFVDTEGIDAEIIHLRKKTRTVVQAAEALRTRKDKIIKTLMFIDGSGDPVLAIVSGDDAVNARKLAKVVGTIGVRMATPREVERHSGYSIGGVPPVGHKMKIRTVIDTKVMGKKFVYGGGGSDTSLLKIRSWDIKKLQNAMIKSIT